MNDKDVLKALKELKEDSKERKFEQTIDLIINLKKFDPKKESMNLFINVPHKVKDKKIAGFFKTKSDKLDTITESEFKNYKDKNKLKNLVKKYDFFVAEASLMPKVATTFGRVLGPAGKMPSPQMGIIPNVTDKTIEEVLEKIGQNKKLRIKESSVKIPVGKEKMDEEKIKENVISVYNTLEKSLPKGMENIKNVLIKFTMSKPKKIE